MMLSLRSSAFLLVSLMLSACAGQTSRQHHELELKPASYRDLPGWEADRHGEALVAFRRSCDAFAAQSPDKERGAGPAARKARSWQAACSQAGNVPEEKTKHFFESHFTVFEVCEKQKRPDGLFTGYYEPVLNGSLTRQGPYQTPVYAAPHGLASKKPYFSRAAIERGALKGKKLEIAWVDDPIALFFMQIQGSGRVRLEDGTEIRLGYAGQNGQAYVPIGKALIERGALTSETVSMQTIRDWLKTNPREADSVMNLNPSYVFFKRREAENPEDGPIGAQGVPLTPGRSLAVDKRLLPYGAPLFVDTTLPAETGGGAFRRLVIAQDTGGAIEGAVRGDVFFGAGEDAAKYAGYMKQPGRYWVLLPKEL